MAKKILKILAYTLGFVILCFLLLFLYIRFGLNPAIPQHDSSILNDVKITVLNDSTRIYKNNWLTKNNYGLWEEYIEGEAFERGVILGKLNENLLEQQEKAFVDQIKELVPNESYLNFLRYFIRFFNKDLFANVKEEYQLEILGESYAAPKKYDFIAPAFERMINYHAAHDIGHALQSLAMVGCSSFAVNNAKTTDSSLLIGRNFDFYSGDDFAKNKIILFCKPTQGYKLMLYTWPGMIGCVSGMNEHGLTVTINAAKSDIPTHAATPISILAREILQYAKTIDEAYSIANKRTTFVAESILIGSALDKKAAIIEKSPTTIALFPYQQDLLLCTNHYQSTAFQKDKNNLTNIQTSASLYRYKRLSELVGGVQKIDAPTIAAILRDQKGLNDASIGMGNEKAMNQLIAHHSIIFEPEKRLVYVSTFPFQIGAYLCYDLNQVFADTFHFSTAKKNYVAAKTIPADSFLYTKAWKDFEYFKSRIKPLKNSIKGKSTENFSTENLQQFIASNPDYYYTYELVGDYYAATNNKTAAAKAYQMALSKEINTTSERDNIKQKMIDLKNE